MPNIWITAPGFAAVASFAALWCYRRFPFFRKLCIPQALLAGFFLLLCGPEIFSFLPEENYSAWKTWPGYLISFLFAGIILGDLGINTKDIPNVELDRENNYKKVLQQSIFVWFIALSQLALGFLVVSIFSLALLAALFIHFIGKKTLLLNNEITSEIRKFTAIILDILILSAVATLKLTVFQKFLFPFLAITSAAILWCTFLFVFFARQMLPTRIWKELGILNFGMSTGVTALGLMLLKSFRRQIDPEVARLYAMAAPFSAPLIGGGAISLLLPELTARGHSNAIMSVLIAASALLYIAGSYLNRKTDY